MIQILFLSSLYLESIMLLIDKISCVYEESQLLKYCLNFVEVNVDLDFSFFKLFKNLTNLIVKDPVKY